MYNYIICFLILFVLNVKQSFSANVNLTDYTNVFSLVNNRMVFPSGACTNTYMIRIDKSDSSISITGWENGITGTLYPYSQGVDNNFSEFYKLLLSVPINTNGNYIIKPILNNSQATINSISVPVLCKAVPGNLNYSKPLINGYPYKSFSGYYTHLAKIDVDQLFPNNNPVYASNITGYGFRMISSSSASNYRYLNSYYMFISLILGDKQLADTISTTTIPIYNQTSYLQFLNPLYSKIQSNPPITISNNTYPPNCNKDLKMKYWHCYNFYEYSLEDSNAYLFQTTQISPNSVFVLNFKVLFDGNVVTYLNVIPSSSTSNNYAFTYYGTRITTIQEFNTSFYNNNLIPNNFGGNPFYDSSYSGVSISWTSPYLGPIVLVNNQFSNIKQTVNYPFGVASVSSNKINYNFEMPTLRYLQNPIGISVFFGLSNNEVFFNKSYSPSDAGRIDNQPPILYYYGYEENGSAFSIVVSVGDANSGVGSISLNLCGVSCYYQFSPINLIQGNIFNGTYRITIPKAIIGVAFATVELTLIDRVGNSKVFKQNDVYNSNLDIIQIVPYLPPLLNSLDFIKDIYFSENDVDVTNSSKTVTMYLKTGPVYKNYSFALATNFRIVFSAQKGNGYFRDETDQAIISNFNSTTNYHEFSIRIPANTFTGPVSYMISPIQFDNVLLYSIFNSSAELRVKSLNSDIMPPLIENFISTGITTIPSTGTQNVSFSFDVIDSINGFNYGIITVISDIDPLGWNFTINSTNNNNQNSYTLNIPVSSSDVAQTYSIAYAWLVDKQGHVSEYPSVTKVSPFMKLDLSSLSVTTSGGKIDCLAVLPTIIDFTVSPLVKTNSGLNKTITFTLTTKAGNGYKISQRHDPIVYLSASNLAVVPSTLSKKQTNDDESVIYYMNATIPFSFGYPDGIGLSVFGIVDECLNTVGFSTNGLKSLSKQYYVNNSVSENPEIQNATYNNGLITINGFRMGYKTSSLIIKFVTSGASSLTVTSFISFSDRLIITDQIKSYGVENKIQLAIQTSDNLISDYYTLVIPADGSLTPSPTSTSTNTPTPKPKQCPGTPPCGGPTKGICALDYTCTCFPPNTGLDCLSITSGSNGTVDPNAPNINFNYEGTYKSLIVVYSLKELDFNGNLVREFIFSNWSFIQNNSDHFQFNTSIEIGNTKTNIIVKIVRYHEYKTINFANSNISIEPNTVKYSIDMDKYNFKSNLNTLQLLISASLETNETSKDICSSSQFGDNGDSSYIQVKIDNVILLGRFLKRSIIDGLISTISQTPINTVDINNSSNSKSFIAMEIPNYRREISLDPNFSVLVDSRPANSDDPNSICSINKKGLTTPQLVGIIVGGAFFLVIFLIIISIVLYRHHTPTRLLYYRFFKRGFSKKNAL
ncbi:hypothetical protein RB653_004160 [Dictyostelium firmibasis]|uniref:EGF-like domain-containing protein n=1 Tax=Dictyostelium firmibasis TaxID=79012 RepID=A0AAN7Z343_9MYCE